MSDEPEDKPKSCPKCGQTPSIIRTMFGAPYVICLHCRMETKACTNLEQAIFLWNSENFETTSYQEPAP